MEKTYPQGNSELLSLLRTRPFDRVRAEQILSSIEEINAPVLDEKGYSTTYLGVACDENNYDAVALLFQYGADPNTSIPELIPNWPLWNLQFFAEEPSDDKIRLKIAKLFFENGADPSLCCEGEFLYDSVVYEVYNEPGGRLWEYFIEFYKLLLAYGAVGQEYGPPSLAEPIDKNRIEEYDIVFRKCEDGYHIEGHLISPEGRDIGIL